MSRSRIHVVGWALAFLMAIAVAITPGCGKKHDDLVDVGPIDPDDLPPVPINVTLAVATSRVSIAWTVANTEGVTEYRIYRAEGAAGEFQFRDSTPDMFYVDDQVVNGVLYRYQIASVKNSLEGVRSTTVQAIPNVFSIVLEGGALATSGNSIDTGSLLIRVDLVAPATTVSWEVSEDSTFVAAPIRRFDPGAPTGIIRLSSGDGLKTVYGRFNGEGGSESERVQATIRLDTRAIILEVTEDSHDLVAHPGGPILGVNDTLHVTVEADTTGGQAEVDIGNAYFNLRLFDDGSNGDAVALDGVYERDFVVTAGLEVVDGVIVGSLRDDVGNFANEVFSATKVTIQDPPGAVSFARIEVLGGSANLYWTRNNDSDFAEYRLYRSDPNGTLDLVNVQNNLLVATFDTVSETSRTVSGLAAGATYQFGITVADQNGFIAPLNPATVGPMGYDPQLTNPNYSPGSGDASTLFRFQCTYLHALDLPPVTEGVRLVLDGNLIAPMSATGANWDTGVVFEVFTTLPVGSHTYAFQAEAQDGSHSRLPADPGEQLVGPSVTN